MKGWTPSPDTALSERERKRLTIMLRWAVSTPEWRNAATDRSVMLLHNLPITDAAALASGALIDPDAYNGGL